MTKRDEEPRWVLLWHRKHDVLRFLHRAGFRFACRVDDVSVYRPAWH